MWKRIKKIWQSREEESVEKDTSPKGLINTALKEITEAIEKNEELLQETTENRNRKKSKVESFLTQSDQLEIKIKQAIGKGKDLHAQELLAKRKLVDQQLVQYSKLYETLHKTVVKLEAQISRLKWQKEEINSKEVVLSAKLESAQTQKELDDVLGELEEEDTFELFEEEIIKLELERSLTNDLLELGDEIEKVEEEASLDSLREEIEEEKRLKREKEQKEEMDKISQLFERSFDDDKEKEALEKKQKEIGEQREKLFDQLFSEKKEKEKSNQIDDFFTQEKQKEKSVDDFFTDESKKNKDIDDFFNQTDEKLKKKKDKDDDDQSGEIEDFFK